ncbi:hypothetical protein PV783_34065 [Chitinophaga sp. CC14]|uniref:hypothetical protein n=1 Tax=Chitinophaga sp. CC14 TaxID=3029199 RepID=UPI003B7B724B
MKLNKRKGIIQIPVTVDVTKSYFIRELAYHMYKKSIADIADLPTEDAIMIIFDHAHKYGRLGFTGGVGEVMGVLGDGPHLEEYNECYNKATAYVEKNLPVLKNEQ